MYRCNSFRLPMCDYPKVSVSYLYLCLHGISQRNKFLEHDALQRKEPDVLCLCRIHRGKTFVSYSLDTVEVTSCLVRSFNCELSTFSFHVIWSYSLWLFPFLYLRCLTPTDIGVIICHLNNLTKLNLHWGYLTVSIPLPERVTWMLLKEFTASRFPPLRRPRLCTAQDMKSSRWGALE